MSLRTPVIGFVAVSIVMMVGANRALGIVRAAELPPPATDKVQEKPKDSRDQEVRSIVIKNRAAVEVAAETQKRLAGRFAGLVVTSDAQTNLVLVQGTSEAIEQVEKIIGELDRSPRAVEVARDERGTSLRICVYRVGVPQAKAMQLRAGDLAGSTNDDASLHAALEKLGSTRLLYCCDQVVELTDKPSLTIGSQVPFVTGAKRGSGINYQSLGCTAQVSGGWRTDAPNQGLAQIRVEISDVSFTDLELGLDYQPSVIQSVKQQFSGPCESGRAIVLVSLGSTSMRDTAIAYVTRIEIRRVDAP